MARRRLPCANAECWEYEHVEDAISDLFTGDPVVLGFGEAHAQADQTGPSSVRLFSEVLLPALAPTSSALLVELLVPPSGCAESRQEVQKESDAVTSGQSSQNQNEYVKLGFSARARGVLPDVLHPSCAEFAAIAKAEIPVIGMMETIARLSARWVKAELPQRAPERPHLLIYGGALHNDVLPRESAETWSYARQLPVGTAYREIDLVQTEKVQGTDSWKKFRWYDAVGSLPAEHLTVLVRLDRDSYAWVFPRGPEALRPSPQSSAAQP